MSDRPYMTPDGPGGGSDRAKILPPVGSVVVGCSTCGGPEPCPCEDVIESFVALMRRELIDNARKGGRGAPAGWEAADPDYLLNEAYYHLAKLHGAVRDQREGAEGADAAVAEHAADVANLAMMLADAAGVLEISKREKTSAS